MLVYYQRTRRVDAIGFEYRRLYQILGFLRRIKRRDSAARSLVLLSATLICHKYHREEIII